MSTNYSINKQQASYKDDKIGVRQSLLQSSKSSVSSIGSLSSSGPKLKK